MGNERTVKKMKKKLLIFGYGYCANYISEVFLKDDWDVYGISRSINSFKKENLEIISWYDLKKIKLITDEVNKIIISTPPFMGKDPVLINFQSYFKKSLKGKWIGYLSSTSVYGDHKGEWVNENSKLKSESKFGLDRINIEKDWLSFSRKEKFDLTIFRLSGIYGPKRNPFDKVKDREFKCIIKKNHLFNRIHVEDIALIIKKCISLKIKELVFNLSDDLPSTNYDFVKEASNLLNLKAPNTVLYNADNLSQVARSFYEESKKVSNARIKKKLDYEFLYPNYILGLRSIYKMTMN